MAPSMQNVFFQALRVATRGAPPNALRRARPGWSCSFCRVEAARRSITSTMRQQDESAASRNAGSAILQTPAATSTALPSHLAKRRSAFTKRISALTDSVLARASIAGQHINTYTGTDFSGIEALRKEIGEEESAVKTQHASVGAAKTKQTQVQTKQASSQKEIVGLLERKSSWIPADLDRYMSLVRSEHSDEQAVQKATEELAVAERHLEDTRSLLERLERKQYHEEQIWSDTIRRNSTWVTIGLMGVNILLLLGQISIFEPYRRRKIVKQIKEILDERSPAALSNTNVRQTNTAAEPAGVSLQPNTSEVVDPFAATSTQPAVVEELSSPSDLYGHMRALLHEPLGQRSVQIKQIDMTTIALESAAAGMAFAGMIALLLLRRSH